MLASVTAELLPNAPEVFATEATPACSVPLTVVRTFAGVLTSRRGWLLPLPVLVSPAPAF